MKLPQIRRILLKTKYKFQIFLIIAIGLIYYKWEKLEELYESIAISTYCRPWYFKGGLIRPTHHVPSLKLWPEETDDHRILDQLMYIPKTKPKVKKKIFIQKLKVFKVKTGSGVFRSLNCPVKACEIVEDQKKADAVLFSNAVFKSRQNTSSDQIWILYMLESPYYAGKVLEDSSVNWTASYRLDSDLVTPYDIWVYYDESNRTSAPVKNYAAGKTKKVAWFVSNCRSKNNRLEYAKKLSKYISVDIFGKCGNQTCDKKQRKKCRKMISRDYKFYLSFENANCRDYITEKFYTNGLKSQTIPIVMGAPKEDYEKLAPDNSFIHIEDFESPEHLAQYLHYLDSNDDSYNSYFHWIGKGEFINTYFFCRLCAMLHTNRTNYYYRKLSRWWRKPRVCIKTFWNKRTERKILESIIEKKVPVNITQTAKKFKLQTKKPSVKQINKLKKL